MFDDNLFDKAFNLFSRVEKQDFEYVYRGYFTHNITKKILVLADSNIQKSVERSTIQKRIYYIMVEGLQNITRHQDDLDDNGADKYPGIFAIQKRKERYYVTTGNLVLNDKIPALKKKITKINSLEKDELKKFHKEVLRAGVISDKGGAGLGLIEMSRKSGNKLVASFELVNEEYSYFYLQTQIPTTKSEQLDSEVQDLKLRKSLISIKKLHLSLIIENIILYFNGFFNQENLLSLLAIIKGRMNMSITTIRLSNVMVEMIQNIIKHGAQRSEEVSGAPGVFFLRQKDNDDFTLTSGNYIEEEDGEKMKQNLEFINSMSQDEISEYYDRILLDIELGDSKKSGLGLSDLRIKSGRKLEYSFHEVEEGNHFYILQTTVVNSKK